MKLRGKQNPMPTHLPYSCLYKDHTHGITPCSLEELGQDQCTLVKEMPAEIHFITSESAGWFSALSFLVPQTQCASKSQSTSRGEQEWMHILNVEVFQTPGATYYLLITRLTVPEILRLPKKVHESHQSILTQRLWQVHRTPHTLETTLMLFILSKTQISRCIDTSQLGNMFCSMVAQNCLNMSLLF